MDFDKFSLEMGLIFKNLNGLKNNSQTEIVSLIRCRVINHLNYRFSLKTEFFNFCPYFVENKK